MRDQELTAGSRPNAVRWEASLLLAAAIAAVGLGTFARGFVGVSDWVFNTENLADSLPLASGALFSVPDP